MHTLLKAIFCFLPRPNIPSGPELGNAFDISKYQMLLSIQKCFRDILLRRLLSYLNQSKGRDSRMGYNSGMKNTGQLFLIESQQMEFENHTMHRSKD